RQQNYKKSPESYPLIQLQPSPYRQAQQYHPLGGQSCITHRVPVFLIFTHLLCLPFFRSFFNWVPACSLISSALGRMLFIASSCMSSGFSMAVSRMPLSSPLIMFLIFSACFCWAPTRSPIESTCCFNCITCLRS